MTIYVKEITLENNLGVDECFFCERKATHIAATDKKRFKSADKIYLCQKHKSELCAMDIEVI